MTPGDDFLCSVDVLLSVSSDGPNLEGRTKVHVTVFLWESQTDFELYTRPDSSLLRLESVSPPVDDNRSTRRWMLVDRLSLTEVGTDLSVQFACNEQAGLRVPRGEVLDVYQLFLLRTG